MDWFRVVDLTSVVIWSRICTNVISRQYVVDLLSQERSFPMTLRPVNSRALISSTYELPTRSSWKQRVYTLGSLSNRQPVKQAHRPLFGAGMYKTGSVSRATTSPVPSFVLSKVQIDTFIKVNMQVLVYIESYFGTILLTCCQYVSNKTDYNSCTTLFSSLL